MDKPEFLDRKELRQYLLDKYRLDISNLQLLAFVKAYSSGRHPSLLDAMVAVSQDLEGFYNLIIKRKDIPLRKLNHLKNDSRIIRSVR